MPPIAEYILVVIVGIPVLLFAIWQFRAIDEDKKDLEKTKK